MDNEKIDQIIEKHQGASRALIQILLDIQEENHWLPKEALERVSEKLQVPITTVRHAAQARGNGSGFEVQPGNGELSRLLRSGARDGNRREGVRQGDAEQDNRCAKKIRVGENYGAVKFT